MCISKLTKVENRTPRTGHDEKVPDHEARCRGSMRSHSPTRDRNGALIS